MIDCRVSHVQPGESPDVLATFRAYVGAVRVDGCALVRGPDGSRILFPDGVVIAGQTCGALKSKVHSALAAARR